MEIAGFVHRSADSSFAFFNKGWENGFRTEMLSKPISGNLSAYRLGPMKRKNLTVGIAIELWHFRSDCSSLREGKRGRSLLSPDDTCQVLPLSTDEGQLSRRQQRTKLFGTKCLFKSAFVLWIPTSPQPAESPHDGSLLPPLVQKGHRSSLLGPFCAALHSDRESLELSQVHLWFQSMPWRCTRCLPSTSWQRLTSKGHPNQLCQRPKTYRWNYWSCGP